MATTTCGWCGTNTHYSGTGTVTQGPAGHFQAYSCDECNGILVRHNKRLPSVRTAGPINSVPQYVSVWAPQHVEGQDFPDVPAHIAEAASEAHKSRSIGNLKSAILMARTVVEATAKNKQVTEGSLFKKIDDMHAKGIIQEFTKQTAHGIRDLGNDMAHGDIELPIDSDDADMVLEFMDAFLAEVFQTPAKLVALQQKTAARKQTATNT